MSEYEQLKKLEQEAANLRQRLTAEKQNLRANQIVSYFKKNFTKQVFGNEVELAKLDHVLADYNKNEGWGVGFDKNGLPTIGISYYGGGAGGYLITQKNDVYHKVQKVLSLVESFGIQMRQEAGNDTLKEIAHFEKTRAKFEKELSKLLK